MQSLLAPDSFTHILRVLNTNVDGKEKIMYALTAIRGIGRRFSNICCKKAEVDLLKRCVAGGRRGIGIWAAAGLDSRRWKRGSFPARPLGPHSEMGAQPRRVWALSGAGVAPRTSHRCLWVPRLRAARLVSFPLV